MRQFVITNISPNRSIIAEVRTAQALHELIQQWVLLNTQEWEIGDPRQSIQRINMWLIDITKQTIPTAFWPTGYIEVKIEVVNGEGIPSITFYQELVVSEV